MDELETSSKAIEDMNATEAAGSSLMPEGLGTDSDALAWLRVESAAVLSF